MQDYNITLKSYGINRRSFAKAMAIFLGSSVVSLGCQSNASLPPALRPHAKELTKIHQSWSPPSAVIQLGHEVIKVTGHIQDLMTQLLDTLSQQPQELLADAQKLAKKLKELHLQAARQQSWIEVKAWRLTSVEGAIYALCTLDVQK